MELDGRVKEKTTTLPETHTSVYQQGFKCEHATCNYPMIWIMISLVTDVVEVAVIVDILCIHVAVWLQLILICTHPVYRSARVCRKIHGRVHIALRNTSPNSEFNSVALSRTRST